MNKLTQGIGVKLLLMASIINLVFLFSELAFNVFGTMFF